MSVEKAATLGVVYAPAKGNPFPEGLCGPGTDVMSGDRTPAHYAGDGVTAGEALRSMLNAPANAEVPPMALFWWALAFKYVWRLFAKGQGASDCAKARDCLARLAEEMGWDDA